METKQCSRCKEVKAVSEFYKDKNKKYGLKSACKKCTKPQIKKYYQDNKDLYKKYYQDNKDNIKKYRKKYQGDNKDKIKKRKKKYREDNKESIAKRHKKYYQQNKEKIYKRKKERRDKDSLYKLSHNIRALIGGSIRGNGYTKNSKTHDILGISFEGFQEHIEKQFTEGMSWDNYGDWEYDHIIPVSSANNEEEMHLLNQHLNFQPLWAKDNLSKGGKYTEENKQAMLTKIRLWKK